MKIEWFSPYHWGFKLKKKLTNPLRLENPVISVGNIELGGTGKTPLVTLLARHLSEKGIKTVVLSRGYRRKATKPCITDAHTGVEECGDEPYMIYQNTGVPVYVNKKRENVKKLIPDAKTVFILDDGFQYFKLKRDLDIVMLSRHLFEHGGNVLPFGLLREPTSSLKRADIIVVNFRFKEPFSAGNFMDKPCFTAFYSQEGIFDFSKNKIDGIKKAVLLSAIAKNGEFKGVIEAMGIKVIKHHAFLDHTYFKKELLNNILKSGYPVITTEKDFYRIPSTYRNSLFYLKIQLKIKRDKEFLSFLHTAINHQFLDRDI